MIEQFTYLTKKEQDLVMDAPALITIWVAGSDNDIDQDEIEGALDQVNWKSIKGRPDLQNYYQTVNKSFSERLNELIHELPEEKDLRDAKVVEQLSGLNAVFPKFEKKFAEQLYASYCELARQVAESSGGVWGYRAVDSEEVERIQLHMIEDLRS